MTQDCSAKILNIFSQKKAIFLHIICLKIKLKSNSFLTHNDICLLPTVLSLAKTYVPDFRSETTEGLIHNGGTKILVRIKSLGRTTLEFINNSGMS